MRTSPPPNDVTTEQATYLAAVRGSQPGLASASALAQDFAAMLRDRQGQRLDEWITHAVADDGAALRGFAMGLLANKDAVQAGLTLSWSTGPCEGHIHKIKRSPRDESPQSGVTRNMPVRPG